MSERDVRRIEVDGSAFGPTDVASAAVVLAITTRQLNRLLVRFREDGGGGLIDATSKLMQLHFVPSESTDSYFAALEGYVNE